MKLLDLFSGIAGFSLAASWAGIETVAFCECDPYCRKVIAKNFPGKPIFHDVRRLNGRKINKRFGPIDIISGGIPCQPASIAGKRQGTTDDRWLWPAAFKLVEQIKPTWCLFENVGGLVTLERGVVFENLLSQLESLGYETQAFVVPACAVDAPHRRDRVWIVAHAERPERWKNDDGGKRAGEGPHREGKASSWFGKRREVLADSGSARIIWRTSKDSQRTSGEIKRRRGSGNTRAAKPGLGRVGHGISSGLDGYWSAEPEVIPRTGKGIPNRTQRLKGLGNAIVPQVAYQFFKYIMEIEGS